MIRKILPTNIQKILWGDRIKWGLIPDKEDPCWIEWQKTYAEFYEENQRAGIGTLVNDAGYSVMSSVDLSGLDILEIGAGDIRHIKYWNGKPAKYILADISSEMMEKAKKKLFRSKIRISSYFKIYKLNYV